MEDDIKNKDLFISMFQLSVESILVLKEDGIIVMANPACEHLFRYNSETLVGKNIEILIPKKFKQHHKKHNKTYNKNPKARTDSKDMDLWGIKKDGTQFSLDISLSPTLVDGKNVTIAFLRDLSKRKDDFQEIKQANNELTESNRKYDALIHNLQGIVYRCKNDRDWTMKFISEGCLAITGYSPEEFLKGKVHFSHITFKEDQEHVWNDTQKAVNKHQSFSLNYRIRDKSGTVKYLQELGRGIFDKSGKLEALEGFITDVTAQKETKTELIDSEDQTRALLEANPDMMFIQNRKGEYLEFHGSSSEKFFVPPDKFIGVNMKKVLPPNVYKKIKTSHKKVLTTKKMQIAGYSVQGKKGMEHYEARVVLLNDHKLLTIVRDVTEEKVKESLLNIRNNALASASNSIIIADAQQPNTPIIYCNDAFEKITGYTKEETFGRNCNFLQNNDRDQKEIDIMKNAIANGEACNVVLRNYRKDGTLFWNDVTITPVHNAEHQLLHFIGVQNDITSKVQERDLKDKTQSILELIAQDQSIKIISNKIIETVEAHFKDCMAAILVLDKDQNTLHKLAAPNLPKEFTDFTEGITIGPKVASFGTTAFLKKEIIVSNIENDILWEDYKDVALKNGLKACWSFPILSSTENVLGTFAIYSQQARKPTNEEKEIALDMSYLASIAIEAHNSIIELQQNKRDLEKYAQKLEEKVEERTTEVMATVKKLVASNLILEDQILITKQAENDAIASKSIASEIAKNFPNGFVVVIDKQLKIAFAEGEAIAQLDLEQYSKEGILVDDITVFSEERKTKIKEYTKKTLSGQHLSFEIFYKNRYFSVNTAPLYNEHNEINNALMVYSDISEQKKIELKIQKAFKKEKELNDLKSRFISMASHEFRTPLSAILTSAVLIGKQNESGKELKRQKYIEQIERNVNNLVIILNDFLSLSKLEEGKVVAMPEQFNLISFSKQLVKEIKPSLKKDQAIQLKTSIKELFVLLDLKLLRHILLNIITNASKYSPEAACIELKITQDKDNVTLQITDQGMGIPEEEQEYLFDRFFRAKNAANIEGTGLGLNIAKSYTEIMGGCIGFKSQLNTGTTFWVEFPIPKK